MADHKLRRALLVAWLALAAACSAPTPAELLADAQTAIAAGELRTAEIHLKNLLQGEPDNVEARTLLGNVLVELGDARGAEQNLRRAIALGADAGPIQVPLARALIGQGKFQEAVTLLTEGPQLEGAARVQALSLEGTALRSLGRRDAAEAAFRAALQIEPASSQVRSELAALLVETRRVGDGRALIEAVLADDAEYVPALLMRADLESLGGQPGAAEATLQRVVDLERARPGLTLGETLAMARLAEVQLELGKIDAARTTADALLALTPEAPRARFVKASVEVRENSLDAAERRLEELIAKTADFWPAYRLLGSINVTQNQLGQATMYLRTAVNNNPDDAAARLQLAEVYIREGNIEEARDLLEAAQPAGISDGLFLAFAGRASQQAGLDEQAERLFRESEAVPPADAQSLVNVSNIYAAAGEFERAVRVLQSSAQGDAQNELLRNYLLALVQLRQGNLAAADAAAQQLAAAQPNAAWPFHLRGTIALVNGEVDTARELLDKAMELDPNDAGILLNAARVAAARSDTSSAQRYLERVVELVPTSSAAHIGLAQLAAARRDFAAARASVERLPPSSLRLRMEGELMAAEGRGAEATATMQRAYDMQPSADLAVRAYQLARAFNQPNAEAKLAAWNAEHPTDPTTNFFLGSGALERGELDAAVTRYEAVLAVAPRHAATLNNLAWVYSQRRDPRALDYAERAHAAEPANPSIADTLGWLHMQSGDAAKALPLLSDAATKLADSAEVQYHFGVALAETGDTAKALAAFDAALSSNAPFEGREDAQRRVVALRGN